MTRDYSAAINSVFGLQDVEASTSTASIMPADALDTSGGINAALDAEPGMLAQQARERLTPEPEAEARPEFPWSNPTAAWYAPPEKTPAEGVSTDTLRRQMAEREILRHNVLPEGPEDDGSGGLLRASFMLNSASRYSSDDAFSAASLAGALGMPFSMTLDSLDKAKELATEFTPEKIKNFAPGFLRLVQYDYDSAMLWRHDIATANAIASSFDATPDVDSRAAALGRGLSGVGTMLLQQGINLGRLGLEGLAALVRGVDENYQPADLADRPIAAALLKTSDTMLDWVRQLSERQKEIGAESPLAGMKVWDAPEVLLDSRWWLENTPQVAASFLPMLGAYAKAGAAGAGLMGLAMNGNEVYVDLLDAGLEDNAETRLLSLVGGVAMSYLDVVGLTGVLGGKDAVKAAMKTALATAARGGLKGAAAHAGKGVATGYLFEGGTEYAQNLVKAGIEGIAKGKDFGGVVAEMGEAATQLEDFILGGLMGGVVRGGHSLSQVRDERLRQRQSLQASIEAAAKSEEVAEARAEVEAVTRDNAEAQRRMSFAQSLLQTVEAVDNSTLHQAAPDIFDREAEKLIPEDARSVWLDADFVQEFVSQDGARLEALGISVQDITDSLQIQAGTVRVPTARLVSRFQGEDRILLLQHARMTPDGMTLTEAQAFDPQKRAEAAAERIRTRNRVNAEIGKERTRLKNEFVQAGYAAHVAEYYATMHAEQAKTFADRYGLDAATLLRERSIVRGGTEAEGQPRSWLTAFDKSPDSFLRQGATDTLLPQRFAGMPGVEADSSQWFGEGKAIPLPGKSKSAEQRKALRNALKQWAKEHFSKKTPVENTDTGWHVQVTATGIEASLSHGFDDVLARSVPFIPQIVESGIHVASTKRKAGLMSHIFANKLRLDGKDYVVGFVVREDGNGNRFYDHELTEVINSDRLAPVKQREVTAELRTDQNTPADSPELLANRGDVINILREKLGVNDGSGQVLFQPTGMSRSLPQRFAEMPGVEADSSQFFGEGKAIEGTKSLRKAVQSWARTAFPQGTTIKNADQGWDVQVTPRGIKNSLAHGVDDTLARSAPFIPQLIESAIHVESLPKTSRLMSHIFANKILLDGQEYVVGFVVREDQNGNRFYDHELTQIINPDSLNTARAFDESKGHVARANRGDVMNILREKLGVNDGSGQVLFQPTGMSRSLPQRFAEMPGVEADSSQFFGEGKAIEGTKSLRKAVQSWARTAFPQGTTIKNADQGWDVQVTPRGIKNSLAHGGNDILARSVPFIPQIVRSGIHVASTEKKAGLMSHIFANKIRLDGKDYVVGFVVREDRTGNRFYDHELTEIINPGSLTLSRDTSKEALGHEARANRGDVMNILREKLGVNDGSGQFLFQPGDSAGARGMVQFDSDGRSVTSIFEGASDLSTPIHEGAHIFINDLIRVVAHGYRKAEQLWARESVAVHKDPNIDDALRQRRLRALTRRWNRHKTGLVQAREDLAALVENANAQREAHGKAIGAELPPVTLEEVLQGTATPEQIRTLQEVNAVSFEAYVREGKAPSSKLAAVFHKMRQWLAAIYRLANIHGVRLTPEARRVFDRMLANDEAIRKSAAGTALAGEGEFLSIIQDGEAELVTDESGQWTRKDRINYKAALNRENEHDRLQELYARAEADVTARMDKAALRDRNKRWREYYAEGKELALQDPYYEILAALSVKGNGPYSGISRTWLEHQYGKAAVAEFMKTAQGRRLLNKNGGLSLDAVGIGDIVGNMDRAAAMGIADADGLYNYLYDNVVLRRRNLADDARAWADQRMAEDDARAEEAGNEPGEAYHSYLDEVEATVLRLAARQDAGWRTPEQQARWVEEHRTPLTQVRRQVKNILRGKPLKDIQPNQFVGEVRKALQERNAALVAGNALDALAAVDRARTALESWIEANRIRKEQEAFERLTKRLASLKRDVVMPQAWTAIQDMLERFGLAARRATGDSPVTLSEAVEALCADSAEISGLPAIAEWLLNEKERGSYKNLTANQLQDVADVLKMLEHMGRQALASNRESEAAQVKELADAGMENMSGLAPVSVAREGTLRRKWQDWMRSYFGGMLSAIQWQMRQADGFSNLGSEGRRGISEERIYGAIADGESRREVRMRSLVERMEPVFQRLTESAKKWEADRGKALTGADGKPLPVPEIMRRGGKLNWTADRVISLALNLGNEGNASRLREGYPDLTADTLAQLVGDDAARLVFQDWQGHGYEGLLSAQDWRDVQEIGNILQTQWQDIQATHERMFGFRPRGVEARPMTIGVNGENVNLNGWYYPAVYDPSLSPEVQKRQEQQDAIVRTEAVCAAPAAKRGFTKARANGGGGAPLLLETGVIMTHLNDVTRFIELAETVRFADRVTRSPEWRDAYIRAFGRQDYDAIRPNLKGIVLEERPATDAVSKSADWVRERLVPWGLAFNFKTALLQSTAIFPAMNDLGAANVLRGVAAVAKGRYALVRQIWEQSPYMKSRARNIDQDLRKTLQGVDARTRQKTLRLLGKEVSWQDVVDAGMLPLVTVDMAASSAIWMAAYNREMSILANGAPFTPGIDMQSEHHAAAVRAADMAVKAVNPDFNPSSRSQFLRSRGAVRLLNIFSSAVVLFAQRRAYNWTAARKAWAGASDSRARLAAVVNYARYEAYDFALQGIAMGIILSLAYGEDDPEKWAKNMGGAWLDAASMRVPVFNNMITGMITGDTWRGMSTVYQQPWDMAKRLRGAAKTGEADKLALSMADVIFFLVKVPASRVARNAARGHEQWEKGEGTPASMLMPRPNSY